MLGPYEEGPRTRVQCELEKCSRSALLFLLRIFIRIDQYVHGGLNNAELLNWIIDAKRAGKYLDIVRRCDRWERDPHGAYASHVRRQRSAKAAAQRRKAAARKAKKEAGL